MLLGTFILNDEVISRYYRVMAGDTSFRKYFGWLITKLPGFLIKRVFSTKNG